MGILKVIVKAGCDGGDGDGDGYYELKRIIQSSGQARNH